MATAMVVAHAKRPVATAPGSCAAATDAKNGGNTAVITVLWKPELAQSYIAQARSSGRSRPKRASSARMRLMVCPAPTHDPTGKSRSNLVDGGTLPVDTAH